MAQPATLLVVVAVRSLRVDAALADGGSAHAADVGRRCNEGVGGGVAVDVVETVLEGYGGTVVAQEFFLLGDLGVVAQVTIGGGRRLDLYDARLVLVDAESRGFA